MIQVVIVTFGSAGDLFPLLRLGTELCLRGHDVTVLGPEAHAPFVAQAALPFHALGDNARQMAVLADPDLWHPTRGFGVVWRATRPAMRELPGFVAGLAPGRPCVLLAHPLALPEADICRAVRPQLKVVAAYLAPSNMRTDYDPLMFGPLRVPPWTPMLVRRWMWKLLGAAVLDPVALPDMNAERKAMGLAPVASLLGYMQGVADLSVTLFPEWFAPTQPDWPRPMVRGDFPLYDPAPDAPLSAELEAFLATGDAPLVFTHGTGNLQAGAYFAYALTASAKLGRRAILLTPYREQLPPSLPATVLWQEYAPFKALLPRCAALVHHGGIGTTAEALRAGIAQLVAPMAHDQFDNAARVERLGVGVVLRAPRLNADRLARMLGTLLASSAIGHRCELVAQRCASGAGLGGVVRAIESAGMGAAAELGGEEKWRAGQRP